MAPRNRNVTPTIEMTKPPKSPKLKTDSSRFNGQVPVSDDNLYKTGIRGKKKYLLYCCIGLLLTVTMGNLLVTITLIGVLRLSYSGPESMEFMPGGELLRFMIDADFDSMLLGRDAKIGSRSEQPLQFEANNREIKWGVTPTGSSVSVTPDSVEFTGDQVEIINPDTGWLTFSSDFSKWHPPFQSLQQGSFLQSLQIAQLRSSSSDLTLKSDRAVVVQGTEGVGLYAKRLQLDAMQNLSIDAKGGSVQIEGKEGIFLDKVKNFTLPLLDLGDPAIETYKICVCRNTGKLFLAPSVTGCIRLNETENPCSD